MVESKTSEPDLEELLSQILFQSSSDGALSTEQVKALQALDGLHRPFKFTPQQRDELRLAWGGERLDKRRISTKKLERIDFFLYLSEHELDSWMHIDDPLMKLKDRKKKVAQVRQCASKLRKAFHSLIVAEESRLALESYATVRLVLERKYEDREINHALEQIDRPSVFALIEPLLRLLEDSADRLEKAMKTRRGKDRRFIGQLVKNLAKAYEKAFERLPSASERGNFVRYINVLRNLKILDQPVGADLIRKTLSERRQR